MVPINVEPITYMLLWDITSTVLLWNQVKIMVAVFFNQECVSLVHI